MPRFSAFTRFGHLAFSSKPSHAESIYRDQLDRMGGDGLNYSFAIGTYAEAKLYASSMHYARVRLTCERAQAQRHPAKAVELLPVHEKDWGLVPGPNDTILDRQKMLAAAMLAPKGAGLANINAVLSAILGSALLGVRRIAAGEAQFWPTVAGSVGLFPKLLSLPAKSFFLLSPVAVTASPVAFTYARIGPSDGQVLQVGDRVCVDAENSGLAETVMITGTGPALGRATATFTKAHSAPNDVTGYPGASLVVGPMPLLSTSQRFLLVIGTSAVVRDGDMRRRVNEAMRRTVRAVDQWAFVEASGPNQIGPVTVGQTPIGTAPLGTSSF